MKVRVQVHRVDGRELSCKNLESGEMMVVKAPGQSIKDGGIVVGDYLKLEGEGDLQVLEVGLRRSEIYRMSRREKKRKVSASNVDYIAIICSVSKPNYKRGLVDRYLVRAEQWGVSPLVIFNKMDQFGGDFDLDFERERLQYREVSCFQLNSKGAGSEEMEELRTVLAHKTVLFAGQSGVGKSTLISALSGGSNVLKSAGIGKSGKGKHTTTWSEIVESGPLKLVDSPGIRSFSLDDLEEGELLEFFPLLAQRARQCRFSSCQHLPSSRECFFYGDEAYDLPREREIVLSYLESYQKLRSEIGQIPHWKKKRA